MVEGEQPLSKDSFDNNADLLVFPDRHEVRTRNRWRYVAGGAFAMFMAYVGLRFCHLTVRDDLWRLGQLDASDLMLGAVLAIVVLPLSVFLFCWALILFRTNPWIVISPAGLEFHNRLDVPQLLPQTFRVTFDDIETVGIKGRSETGPPVRTNFRYMLKIKTASRGDLELRWFTYSRREAARFAEAFIGSMQEMASRTTASG
ncbi:MAG TPA: hypothetical protein VKQ32_02755 [Polyangia bacterium]|nr:hypothetical protein [Polyangia bacterium]